MMQPEYQDVARDAELLAAIRRAVETTEAPDLIDALIAYRAAAPRYLMREADHTLRDLLKALTEQFRGQVIRELVARAAGQDAPTVRTLGPVLGLIAEHRYPGRRELLADLQLSILHPEPLRARLREAWLTDATAMDTANRWRAVHGAESACAVLAGQLDGGERRAVARWVMALEETHGYDDLFLSRTRDESLGGSLAKRRLGWSAEETAELLRSARVTLGDGTAMLRGATFKFALPAAEHLTDADLSMLLPELRTIVDDLGAGRLAVAFAASPTASRRFQQLLDRAAPAPGAPALPPDFLAAEDGFAVRARADLADVLADPASAPLLLHCGTVTSVRASARWQRQCGELAAGYPQAAETLERILRLVTSTKVMRLEGRHYGYVFMTARSSEFVRGAVWAYAAIAGPAAAPLLGDVAVHCGEKELSLPGSMVDGLVANSAVAALGALDGEAAMEQLRRVQRMAEHRTFLKSVAAAFDAVALRSGLTREQIIERGVPDHGLDAAGRHTVALGKGGKDGTATIVVHADGSAAVEYSHGGAAVRSLPAAVRDAYAAEIKALKALLKEVQGTLRSERDRVEAILATDRTWPAADWSRHYIAHPLTGPHARRLIWEVAATPDGPWSAGLPESPDSDSDSDRDSDSGSESAASASAGAPNVPERLRAADGTVRDVAPDDIVRLWHPVRATAADIEAWRAHLTDTAFRQPFKQAFRELYLLTPAEEATASYSNRFAGHILRYGQTKALTVQRGWTGLSLGGWSQGAAGEAVHEFPGTSWRARFFLETATVDDGSGVADLCATDQVRFEHRAAKTWRPANLADVPAAVLTEAFRDVDLFVGVASIGADPRWTDRGDDRHDAYWREFGFGALPESAEARRGTLARLLPRTRIADRVELTDRFLKVRGTLRTYKIHLGSGNVLMEPDDTYLCIVDARASKDATRLFLPFEENGGVLSLIVSKAFLLADDHKITDVGITRQIQAR